MDKKNFHLLITIFLAAGLSLFSSCKNTTQENGKNVIIPDKKTDVIAKRYLQEGFVQKDTFRIVIVSNEKLSGTDHPDILDQAKKRSMASLQKFLESKNRPITRNVNAHLTNLINSKGKLENKEAISNRNSVFYYIIKKRGIKRYLHGITSQR